MPLVPIIVAAKHSRDVIKLAHKALEHHRSLPRDEQDRLRSEVILLKTLSTELAAVTAKSVRGRVRPASDGEPVRDSTVVVTELRDALSRFAESTGREAAVVAKGESRKMRYAAKAVGFGARRLDGTRTRTSTASPQKELPSTNDGNGRMQ